MSWSRRNATRPFLTESAFDRLGGGVPTSLALDAFVSRMEKHTTDQRRSYH